jgi:glutathione synthase
MSFPTGWSWERWLEFILNISFENRVIDGDEFIGNLWNIHLKVKAEGYTQVSA